MSSHTDTQQPQLSLSDCREYLNDEVATFEGLIAGMDPETQATYRASSKAHNALAALDRMEALLKTATLWVEGEVQAARSEAPEGSATENAGEELLAEVAQLLGSCASTEQVPLAGIRL